MRKCCCMLGSGKKETGAGKERSGLPDEIQSGNSESGSGQADCSFCQEMKRSMPSSSETEGRPRSLRDFVGSMVFEYAKTETPNVVMGGSPRKGRRRWKLSISCAARRARLAFNVRVGAGKP